MDISQRILSDITVFNKYSKYIPDLKRRETWDELCKRNKEMHLKKYPYLRDDIEEAYKYVYEKKILPSMRSMQFGGLPIELANNRIYNCAYAAVNDIAVFWETMFLLLGGTGMGYSVQKQHVDRLPIVKGPLKRPRKFLVGDSIEGWADSIKVLIKAYYLGKSDPNFDFRDIRPKGSRLITSGGKAPGPDPLKICLTHIRSILDNAVGRKLNTLECHDIMCHIADSVLSGGIRRAALIALFSADDMDMLSCKVGNWWELNPQRGRANNSVVLHRQYTNKEQFDTLWERVQLAGTGEPGIFWTNDFELGTNPCAEISLNDCQFCVSGDTKLITEEGVDIISNLVGKEVSIWNGEKWSKVTPYQTGEKDILYRVFISDGSYLDATANHKFLVKNRFQKEYKEVETIDLIGLLNTSKYVIQVPRHSVEYTKGVYKEFAYDIGFVLGDGHTHKNYVYGNLYNKDKQLNFESTVEFQRNATNVYGTDSLCVKFVDLDYNLCSSIKYEQGLPAEVFTWDKPSILRFVAGWADADGSQASKGIRIYGREDKIRDGQLLLSKCGIHSSVNLMQKAGVKTNLGIRKNDIWYLQITRTVEIPCQRLVCNNSEDAKFKGKNQIVKRIEKLEGVHPSYCLTEEELHQCVFNNILTKQCNLSEINMSNVVDQADFNERAKLAARLGTLQAGYTEFHYLRSKWQDVTEKEALIGVGQTGIASEKVLALNLEQGAKFATEENERIAERIGIKPAARVTTVKPSGTSSLTVGSSSGIHAWHNDYYIRRVRVGKNEPLYKYLNDNFPELIEDCKFKPHLEAVVSFPQKAPESAILRTESYLDLLERVKKYNLEWVKPGHRDGLNRHNVSCTISIKPEDWKECGKWMWKNKDNYTGIAVLPYDGGTYVQAPFEECTKEKYEELFKYLDDIDLTQVIEEEDTTDLKDQVACSGGLCEL